MLIFSFVSLFSFVSYSLSQTPPPTSTPFPCKPAHPVPIDRWRGEYFNNRDLSGAPVLVRDDGSQEIDFEWGLGGPSKECNVPVDRFSVRWTRTVTFAGGAYRFTITSDDGVRLLIDGQEKFNSWQSRPLTTNTVDVAVSPGNHKIVFEYFENFGSAVIKLNWKLNPCISTVPSDHWRGEYFNNDGLSGQPVMVRDDGDSPIFFDWREKSPDYACGIKEDFFSARWSRRAAFASGIYRFDIQAEGGVRVYIDGQLRFDQWRSQTNTRGFFDIQIEAGYHQIVFEHRDYGRRRALASMSWKPLPCIDTVDPAHWKGEYFNSDNLSGQPVMVRDDGDIVRDIEFNWDDDSPSAACSVRLNSFSARWTGSPLFDKGFHRFTVIANGGIRLSIDGQLKIDQWIQKSQRQSIDIELTPGRHQVVLEYADFGGKSSVKLTRRPPPCITTVPADAWRGEYFNNISLSGRPTIVRNDGVGMIDFDWGLSTPNPNCLETVDGFSVRWSRTVTFAAGTYRFTASGDDGLRLFVDGKKVIDDWQDQLLKAHTVDLELAGGPHRIVLEYYEKYGSATVKFSWAVAPCAAVVPADRWKGEYFNNPDLSGKPALARDEGEGVLNFVWGLKGPDSNCGIDIDNFSARWTRTASFNQGVYRFTISADDGVRVFVDRQLRFERWVDQTTTHTFDVELTTGNHQITIEYYERWGSAVLKFAWQQNPCFPMVDPGHWRGEYFNNPDLNGRPVMVRDDGDGFLDFNLGGKSPSGECPVNADDFSVRWSRKLILAAGLYRLSATGDDGVRLSVNGRRLIDQWRNQQRTTHTVDIYLRDGNHRVVLEYYNHTGEAVAQLSWQTIGARKLNP